MRVSECFWAGCRGYMHDMVRRSLYWKWNGLIRGFFIVDMSLANM